MPKSTKRFIISEESLNRYGFRVMTDGIDLTQFLKNPLCYYLHRRSDKDSEFVALPIGHWQDIEVKDNQVTGTPFFSDNDEFAMQIFHKVEEGTIKMASAGLEPIAVSEEPSLMLPTQLLPSVTKSIMYEASICDMGVNNNALTLYKEGEAMALSMDMNKEFGSYLIQLSASVDIKKRKILNINTMNPSLLALAITLGMKNATEDELVEKLTINHAEYLSLSKESNDTKVKLKEAEKQLSDLKALSVQHEIDGVLNLAVSDGKITEAQKEDYLELAKTNLSSVKNLFEKMPKHTSAEALLAKQDGDGSEGNALLKLSYDEAHKSGQLAIIKDKYPAHFEFLFEKQFHKKPTK